MLKQLAKIFGDPQQKEIAALQTLVDQVNQTEETLKKLSDSELQQKTAEFKARLEKGETLDDIAVEAFAVVKNACCRLTGKKFQIGNDEIEWNMVPFDVQIMGAFVLHRGKITEMKTGEGKTLVAVLAVYLNALTGKGVHVITVNDYLAKRDAQWMSQVYTFLGLSVGVILHGLSPKERKEAYAADITYGTNNEFGFDYLRDNMATRRENMVQRELNYAIVDEVDSILIDESRTPLIISAPAEESTEKYMQYATLVRQLKENEHYNIDEKRKTAVLSEEGIKKMEQLLGVENIYTEKGFLEVHHIEQALRAESVYKKDVDYVVSEDGEVVIVDEFTGRLMPGRRYSGGLHQAIEAKEKVEIKRQSRTLATITFQNYFRLYDKLAGMTGTALTEAEEFSKIYNLDVVVMPTNRPLIRDDRRDTVYKNERGKFLAIAKAVKEKHEKGQPVLIGTISIEKSEALSGLLEREKIPHSVLNAKHHEKEALIVSEAGKKGAVTIATNMAGRGTDIKISQEVRELGGLAIMGSERHESRRIDNQLRGRAGRQGDPGESQFFVSLEDSLMRLFGSEKLQKMMEFMNIPDDMPIENTFISGAIESAQKKVEGHHFDIRKHLVEYDSVMNKHREIIYARRRQILLHENLKEEIQSMLTEEVQAIVANNTTGRKAHEWNLQEIYETIHAIYHDDEHEITLAELEAKNSPAEIEELLLGFLQEMYAQREAALPEAEMMREVERSVYLRTIDSLWMEHIDAMTYLRQNVSLRGYGQRDPLMEYKGEAFRMFEELLAKIRSGTVITLFKVRMQVQQPVIRMNTPQKMNTNDADIEANLSSEISTNEQPEKSGVTLIRAEDDMPKNLSYSSGNAAQGRTVKAGETLRNAEKVGRNDPCPCGSGKKYKKCHGMAG